MSSSSLLGLFVSGLAYFVFCIFIDLASLCLRPLIFIAFVIESSVSPSSSWSSLSHSFISLFNGSSGLLAGGLCTLSTLLIISSFSVCIDVKALRPLVSVPFFIDALIQTALMLCTVHDYFSSTQYSFRYPLSESCMLLLVELLVSFAFLFPRYSIPDRVLIRFICLYFSLVLTHLSLWSSSCISSSTPLVYLFVMISFTLFSFAVTPRSLWSLIQRSVEFLFDDVLKPLCLAVYRVCKLLVNYSITLYGWIVTLRGMMMLHNWIINPLWCATSPFILPSIMSVCAVATFKTLFFLFYPHVLFITQSVSHLTTAPPPPPPPLTLNELICAIMQLICALSASFSSLLLFVHAISRVPLTPSLSLLVARLPVLLFSSRFCVRLLWFTSFCFSLPYEIVMRVLRGRIVRFVARFFRSSIEFAFKFAVKAPFLSVPIVLACNVAIIYALYASTFVMHVRLYAYDVLVQLGDSVHIIHTSSLDHVIVDSTLVMIVLVVVQCATHSFIKSRLYSLLSYASHADFQSLSAVELNSLAASMPDPRQCGRCNFGPVDHSGCTNLAQHHNEHSSSSYVSNACPRCGWFASSLTSWPYWASNRSAVNNEILTQRVWGEVIMVVRASAKSLIVPVFLLQIQLLPASLTSSLALSYIVPWINENLRAHQLLSSPSSTQAYPRRQQAGAGAGVRVNYDNADCGHSSSSDNRTVQLSALATFLQSTNPRVCFICESCCICMEDLFESPSASSSLTFAACDSLTSTEARLSAVRKLSPPVLALRCGHILHVACMREALHAVTRSGGVELRHARCPLCREPISSGGATSARMFT